MFPMQLIINTCVALRIHPNVLTFVGVKMLLAHTAWKLDTLVSLGVIVLILATSVGWSLLKPRKPKAHVTTDVSPPT